LPKSAEERLDQFGVRTALFCAGRGLFYRGDVANQQPKLREM
jgi:hypothetical protein